jgi:hypothetical protein
MTGADEAAEDLGALGTNQTPEPGAAKWSRIERRHGGFTEQTVIFDMAPRVARARQRRDVHDSRRSRGVSDD